MCEKLGFDSEAEAWREILAITQRRLRGEAGTHRRECRAYFHPECGLWHLSSTRRGRRDESTLRGS